MSESGPTAHPSSDPADVIAAGRGAMREALRRSASVLKAAGVPFALAGSFALWAYGAPEGDHDVDLVVTEEAVEAAATALEQAGFRIERPPEDWLFKAYDGAALVDVLHRLVGVPVQPDLLDRAEELDVLGLRIPVLPPTEVVSTKVLSMTEQYCDFGALLPSVRAVRERLDWDALRRAADGHPYAEAFLFLLGRLQIAP